ncbi:MAG TPA: aldo/keto reductase [Candidatus Acidoferrales bacterium]|nr:aldo/keto reductase [Candidatus Acidoferrales bacterium]
MDVAQIPSRTLGATGVHASVFGLGGEGVLCTFGYSASARDVIETALREGVTYFDSARAYAGSEQYYGATLGAARANVFLASKAHDRSRAGAMVMLDQTLQNMRTDHLDLWQLHDLRNWEELDEICAPGGAYEAFVEAKRAGKTRFIGVTGHHDPAVLAAAVERLSFDMVLMPVNPCEPQGSTFLTQVGARAIERGMGVIGMKVLARGLLRRFDGAPTTQELMDYALSQPIHAVIIGCSSVDQVHENAAAARAFAPMPPERQRELERRLVPVAEQALYYRGVV